MDTANYPHVTAILQMASLSDYSGIPENIMDAARNRGDVGHQTCALYDDDNLDIDTVDKRIMPYLNAYIKFLKDTGAIIEAVEQPVQSDIFKYQGTPDRIVVIGGKRGVLEIKLTANFMPSIVWQLAAYQRAWSEQNPKQKAVTRYAVRLLPDGNYELPPKDFFRPGDFNVFLAALVIVNAKKERGIKL